MQLMKGCYSLGHDGNRTNGLIIGSFFAFSVLSFEWLESSFSVGFRSKLNPNVDPANKLDFEPKLTASLGLNRLPQLMRRDAAGEQLKNRIWSKPNVFGFAPECRRSLSVSYSLTVKLGEWLECRRISFIRCTRSELPISGDGGSTTTDTLFA